MKTPWRSNIPAHCTLMNCIVTYSKLVRASEFTKGPKGQKASDLAGSPTILIYLIRQTLREKEWRTFYSISKPFSMEVVGGIYHLRMLRGSKSRVWLRPKSSNPNHNPMTEAHIHSRGQGMQGTPLLPPLVRRRATWAGATARWGPPVGFSRSPFSIVGCSTEGLAAQGQEGAPAGAMLRLWVLPAWPWAPYGPPPLPADRNQSAGLVGCPSHRSLSQSQGLSP